MRETSNRNSSKAFRSVATKTALALTLAIGVIGITAAPAAHAGGNSSKNSEGSANFVGHVTITGGNVIRMLLVKRDGKEFLALGLDSSAQVAMVDVSDPHRPHALDSAAQATGRPGAEVNVLADNLNTFGKSDAATPASAEPKEIRSLSGVTAFVIDAAHGLIYATNNDGLWIVKTRRQANEDARPDYYGG